MPRHVEVSPPEDANAPPPSMVAVASAPRVAPATPPAPPTSGAATAPASEPVSEVLAAALSLLVPGLGQLYAGQTAKGILLVVAFVFLCGLGGLLNIVAAIDALWIAQRKNRGEAVGDFQFF